MSDSANPATTVTDTPQSGDRRAFLRKTGFSAFGAMLGMSIPFERNLPYGLVPVALAQDTGQELMSGKDGLIVLSDRPLTRKPLRICWMMT
ncbi:hypothetical protein [Paracoccus xiamenensis]|uniref:hypothetical protein n=1 Tax=Paracoccus xiamenensis TaxID=2714901 RepID=UPI001F413EC8|nr:hypothetical protein [Paracoccus xiamenensis]